MKLNFSVEFDAEPVETTECYFCNEDTYGILDSDDQREGDADAPRMLFPATFVVSGHPLCTYHTYQELSNVILDPGVFLHSWNNVVEEWDDWKDAVPFLTEVRSVFTP